MTVNVEKVTAVTELCMLTENHDLSYCWFTWRKELIDNRKKSRNLNSWSMAENCRSTPWQVIIIREISPSLLVKLDGRCIRNKFLQHFMKYCWESMLPVLPPAWASHHAILVTALWFEQHSSLKQWKVVAFASCSHKQEAVTLWGLTVSVHFVFHIKVQCKDFLKTLIICCFRCWNTVYTVQMLKGVGTAIPFWWENIALT